ncbi:MAG TPA: porin family protein [Bacteroidia bacterium]|nr:porin family protein [Bacteroidia bacterium]
MKKTLLTLSLIAAFPCIMNAQSFILGAKIGYNTTWLMNKNVFDQDEDLNPNTSFGANFGLSGYFYFNDKVGVGAEIHSMTVNQKYSGEFNDNPNISFDAKETVKVIDIPILLQLTNESGLYFEVGPKITLINSAEMEFEVTPTQSPSVNFSGRDVIEGYNSTLISGVFGFGVNISAGENLFITTGIRLASSFSDATKEFTEDELGHLAMDDKLGISSIFAHTNQSGNYKYEKTTLATGGIILGIFYRFGGN